MVHGNIAYRHPRSHVPPMSWPLCRPFTSPPSPEPRCLILLAGTPAPSGTPCILRVYPVVFEFTRVFPDTARPFIHVPPCRCDWPMPFEIRHADLYCRQRSRKPVASVTLFRVVKCGSSQQILSFPVSAVGSLTDRHGPWLNLHTSTRTPSTPLPQGMRRQNGPREYPWAKPIPVVGILYGMIHAWMYPFFGIATSWHLLRKPILRPPVWATTVWENRCVVKYRFVSGLLCSFGEHWLIFHCGLSCFVFCTCRLRTCCLDGALGSFWFSCYFFVVALPSLLLHPLGPRNMGMKKGFYVGCRFGGLLHVAGQTAIANLCVVCKKRLSGEKLDRIGSILGAIARGGRAVEVGPLRLLVVPPG